MVHLVDGLTGEYIAHGDGFEGELQAEHGALKALLFEGF
jgi:hypothetical protein